MAIWRKLVKSAKVVFWLIVALVVLGICTIVNKLAEENGIFTEQFETIVFYVVAGLLVVGGLLGAVEEVIQRKRRGEKIFGSHNIGDLAVIAFYTLFSWFATFIYTLVILAIIGFAGMGYQWAVDPRTSRSAALVLCTPVTLVAALLLFWFRLYVRSIYGMSEVAVRLLVALSRILGTNAGQPILTFNELLPLLTAGVYLVVRGLDNFYIGVKSKDPDLFVRLARRYRKRQALVVSASPTPEVITSEYWR
jgi:hypothetical protein